jgi:hypothetical protein
LASAFRTIGEIELRSVISVVRRKRSSMWVRQVARVAELMDRLNVLPTKLKLPPGVEGR